VDGVIRCRGGGFNREGGSMDGATRTVGRVKVCKVDGEYRVKVWDARGVRWESADYFTADREDAMGTAALMTSPRADGAPAV
jgi:hypothetical protein